MKNKRFVLSNTQVILLSFFGTIFLGGLLLSLPFSAADGKAVPLTDCFFTAVTSVCVTGLVTVPVVQFSLFGQAVILLLIQMGGLGIVTFMCIFALALHRKMGMGDRLLLQDAFNLNGAGGLVKFIRRAVIGTLAVEGVGACLTMIAFVPRYGVKGVWYALFHAVSAFCNAGLDVLGTDSLISWQTSPLVCGVTELLIILGGIGFVVWWDVGRVIRERKGWRGLTLHSKIALSATAALLLLGTVVFLVLEHGNGATMGDLSPIHKIRMALFQSVTARTAGFAAVDQAGLTGGSVLFTCLLMFIGGSPVGTAGGVKTVTIVVLMAFAFATARGKNEVSLFSRRVPRQTLNKAVAVVCVSFVTVALSTLLLCLITPLDGLDLLYESVSATATVGLSRGITSRLPEAGKWIVMCTMYLGRVGPLSLAVAFGMKRENRNLVRDPEEQISVG